ncbi:TlpA disulfide reductase family protein [uncultured Tenacibaculum sp.]|uniref:TlpA disulfide reductase family protein n=1 Tax=uncultured Tenacibaculum sp. TaxID=174713 RepID=UPI0026040B06|nr:TlpA disulfide reductase family protein [uncultured Tenacibaculum sp.]
MKFRLILLVFASIFFSSCNTKNKKATSADLKVTDGAIRILNYDQLKPLLEKEDDKVHVVNFWATWCKPCVEELPAFEKLNEEYKNKNVELLLVSLDFPNQIESELLPFIKEHQLKPEVVVLDDPDQDKWINGISTEWSGAIPATIIYKNDKRAFYEQSFNYDLLNKELQQFLN